MSVLFYRIGATLAHWLPPPISMPLTALIARSQYHMRARSRRAVLHNLRIIMGSEATEKAIHDAAKNVFSNFGKSIYCFLRLPSLSLQELRARCDYGGLDDLARDLSRRGGFIIAGPHLGPWEIAGACLSAAGVRVHTVALDHPSAGVTALFQDRRRHAGIVSYPIGNSFSLLSEALKQGGCVALLIDRIYGRARHRFSMFDRKVALPTGHAALAFRCRVPIVTAVCVFAPDRVPGGGFKFVFNGPYYPDLSVGEEAAIGDLHRRCRADMEQYIRGYADQWFSFITLEGEDQCPEISLP